MEKITADSTEAQSAYTVAENIQQLKTIFPDAFTENGINFDSLRQLLGDVSVLDEGEEKYGLNWHGKKQTRQIALTPSTGTLLPCPDESVDWSTTKNLFIEGDNLEVLKLLQKSYAGKVKMIYIDPPYNTGKEFIYPDKFQDNLETYLKYTGQVDDEGMKFSSNTETSGRKHTNWLNMMYPRLKLARSLLSKDGIIFISIGDDEIVNLSSICNEIFGAENRVGLISVVSNLKGRSDDKFYATAHNYLLAYQKTSFQSLGVSLPDEYLADYSEKDADGMLFRLQGLRKRGDSAKRVDRPNMFYPFYVDSNTLQLSLEKNEQYSLEVLPYLSNGDEGRWRWGKETAKERLSELTCRTVGKEERHDVFQIDYAEGKDGQKRIKPKSVWSGKEFANEAGSLEVKKLFGKKLFDNPKPTGLIKYCLEHATKDDDIIVDFFSGSCTAADAVMQQNVDDGYDRKFIMVQLPEPCVEESEAYKSGFKNIAEIGKERIRRASKKIKEEIPEYSGDLGFKTLKLASSNIKAWNPDKTDLEQTLLDHQEHLVSGRTEQDVLYELLLKRGVDLNVPIEEQEINGKTIYSIGYGALFICLNESLATDDIEAMAQAIIAWFKELEPSSETHVFFRDSAFADDIAKTNMVSILEQNGINHVRSL